MVNSDVMDKDTALGIDKDCHGLENSTGTISLHKDPTRIMRGIVTVDTWDAFSAHNKDKADDEVKLSIRLRESMNQTILQVKYHGFTLYVTMCVCVCVCACVRACVCVCAHGHKLFIPLLLCILYFRQPVTWRLSGLLPIMLSERGFMRWNRL